MCVCMYACMHACMHACMYVCMYVCMYIHTHKFACIQPILIRVYIFMRIYIYLHTHKYMYMFICTSIYTHIHICTCVDLPAMLPKLCLTWPGSSLYNVGLARSSFGDSARVCAHLEFWEHEILSLREAYHNCSYNI